jgi:uncharacterized membrane protein
MAKRSSGSAVFFWWFQWVAIFVYFPLLWVYPPPLNWTMEHGFYAIGTMLLHGLYVVALSRAYSIGDLSLVYPISRGMAPLLVPILAVFLLGERVSTLGWLMIFLIILGIYTVYTKSFSSAEWLSPLRMTLQPEGRWAILVGLLVTGYTLLDKSALNYFSAPFLNWLGNVGNLICLSFVVFSKEKAAIKKVWKKGWKTIMAAGILAPGGYILVLFAMKVSQVSYVAPAREIGIVVGVLFGILLLKEKYGLPRLVGSVLIATGIIGLALVSP